MLVALATACGEVHFVPSPFTPQAVELIYSSQEHITVVRWRVDAAPLTQTRFELQDSNGDFQPIDFSQSVFAGGENACGDGFGTCAQYVVRGQFTAPLDSHPIRAVHDVYGVLPGFPPSVKTVPSTLTLKSFFHSHNDMVYLNIVDAVGGDGTYVFPRPYDRSMWPTNGLCVSDTPPDGVSFSPLDASGGFPPETPLTDDGTYCVAARPVPSDGGDATMVQVRIATLPELVTASQVFDPPVERSPIVYQIILDLEIPVPDRCDDVIQKIESWTGRYLVGGGADVHKLPTINLAANGSSQCAQTNERIVESTDMADQIKQLLTTLSEKHQQVHIMYFNNLDAPLPEPLVTSLLSLFQALSNSPPGYELKLASWMFNPGTGYLSSNPTLGWWAYWPWETADDMFAMMLSDWGRQSLPWTSQEHDPNEPVLLLSKSDTTTYAAENAWVKICSASPQVTPTATQPFVHTITAPAWPITTDDPPAYLVTLQNQQFVAAAQFVEQSAIVNYQVCTRYCTGHPFVTGGGIGATSWTDTYSCAGGSN